jgi:Tfp pilus assembly protein PilN
MIYPRWLQDLTRADFLTSVGLYVAPERLFLVRMRKSMLRVAVLAEESRELARADDPVEQREALSDAIRSLRPRFSPRDQFYVCLSPHHSMALEIVLPQAAEENLDRVVEYEIERQLPFRREDLFFDFLPMEKRGDRIALLLFAAPRRIVNDILDALSAAGVEPKGVETTAMSISNYLLYCDREITGPALVLGGQNQSCEVTGLDFKKNGWGREARIVFSHSLPRTAWMEGAGREVLGNCLRESTKLFAWGGAPECLPPAEGETAPVENLLDLGKEKLWGARELTDSSFLPAVGAALRGLREATFTLNLLPGAKAEKKRGALSRLNAGLTVLLLLGLVAWGGSYPIKDEIRLRQFQKENQKLAPSVEALRREDDELNRLRKEIAFLAQLKQRRTELLRVLDELSRVLPNGAFLNNVRYREGVVELQGTTSDSASNLVPLLERSQVFENVSFAAPSSRGRDGRESFSLKMDIERPKGGAAKR